MVGVKETMIINLLKSILLKDVRAKNYIYIHVQVVQKQYFMLRIRSAGVKVKNKSLC